MKCSLLLVCALAAVHGGGGVTITSDPSKFWTDDYKVFEQIYGKTSDRDLFSPTLPLTYDPGESKWKVIKATDKNEGYFDEGSMLLGTNSQIDPSTVEEKYNKALAKHAKKALKDYHKAIKLTNKPLKFIPASDFTPISENTDPETYKFLNQLESLSQKKEIPQKSHESVNPYLSYGLGEIDAYKSVQNIIDAHETNGGSLTKKEDEENSTQYMSYVNTDVKKRKKKINPRLIQSNHITKPRCSSGRCRNRVSSRSRNRSRPIVRKIKHTIVSK